MVCRLIVSLGDHTPDLGPGAFVHDAACVIGRVLLGRAVSVWPNATIRGDTDRIAGDDIRRSAEHNVSMIGGHK